MLTEKQKDLLRKLVALDKEYKSPVFQREINLGVVLKDDGVTTLLPASDYDEYDFMQLGRMDFINAYQSKDLITFKVNQSGIDEVDGNFGEDQLKHLLAHKKKLLRTRWLLLIFTPIISIIMFLLGFYLTYNGIIFTKNTGKYTIGQQELDNIVLMQKMMMEFYEELQRLKAQVKPENKATYDLLDRITETQEQAKQYMQKQTEANEKLIEIASKKDSVSWLGYVWIAIVFIVGILVKPFIDIIQELIKKPLQAKMETLKPMLTKKPEPIDHDVH